MLLSLTRALGVLLIASSLSAVMGQQTTDEEKALRETYEHGMKKKDPAVRASAVSAYDQGTRDLPDVAGIRLVAKTLAKGLTDDDPSVAQAAVAALSYGRDPETVIESIEKGMNDWRKVLGKTATRPDDESRDLYNQTSATFRAATEVLGRYSDDRSVKVLEDGIKKLRPGGTLENVSGSLLGPMADALLALGSEDAVEAVVKTTSTFPAATFGGTSARERSRLAFSNSLHRSLEQFSLSLEIPPPEFSQNYEQDWSKWFKENKKRFAKKLGKLEQPPGPPGAYVRDDEGMTGRRERP
jgi:hypothetical protein